MTAHAAADYEAFVRANAQPATAPLVPEVTVLLASEVTPLWHATEVDLARSGLPPPYWAFAWPGGQALARFVLDQPRWVTGRRVLDFAAGSGLAGIAAAQAGAAAVFANDVDPYAAAAIGLNAALNGVGLTVDRDDRLGSDLDAVDVVLAGDVCYEEPMASRATAWFRGLARRGTTVLLGDPGRAYVPKTGLQRLAVYAVQTSLDLEDQDVRRTTVWRIAP